MGVCTRFYVKTSKPNEAAQVVIDAVGGDGRLLEDEAGRHFRPVEIKHAYDDGVIPRRAYSGCPEPFSGDSGWYWMDTVFDWNSMDAAWAAWALLKSPLVEVLAYESDMDWDENDRADLVTHDRPPFGQSHPPLGPLDS